MEGDSATIPCLTGLPNEEVFKWVVEVYEPVKHFFSRLSADDQVLLVLMRLRLDLHLCFFAQLFEIGKTMVSELFQQAVCVLAREVGGLIVWPNDESFYAFQRWLHKTQPFNRVACLSTPQRYESKELAVQHGPLISTQIT